MPMKLKTVVHTSTTIAAAHHLSGYRGSCSRVHGHNFKIEVWIEGKVDPATGMVMDFARIKDAVRFYDHRDLNELMDEIPSAENLAAALLKDIAARYGRPKEPIAIAVRVWEGEDSYAEVSSQ